MIVSTMEEVQEGWRRRWSDPGAPPKPSCFNRPAFDWVGMRGCSAWFEGGNAYVTKQMVDAKGATFPWGRCKGCKRKNEQMAEKKGIT